jgi:ankyrin repeat protein
MHLAASYHHRESVPVMQLLFDRGAKVDGEAIYIATHYRVSTRYKPEDQKEMVQWLIDHGADVNSRVNRQQVPLIHCSLPNVDLVRLLLDNGADPYAKRDGKTVFQVAEESGKQELLDLLERYQ